jgi:hypothetical protein
MRRASRQVRVGDSRRAAHKRFPVRMDKRDLIEKALQKHGKSF